MHPREIERWGTSSQRYYIHSVQGKHTHNVSRANGIICGDDVRVIFMSDKTLIITGIDNH